MTIIMNHLHASTAIRLAAVATPGLTAIAPCKPPAGNGDSAKE
jgi:hypothetical protein